MKIYLLFFASCFILLLVSPAYAVYSHEGPVSNDFIMSMPLQRSQIQLSAQMEYANFAEIYAGNTDMQMEPITKSLSRATLMVVPFKAAYGVTDDLSLRLTAPFVSFDFVSKKPPLTQGYGLGDIRIEGVYGLMKETADNPSAAVNVCVKAASGTAFDNRGLNEMPVGSGSTDWMITGIFGKKLGPIDGKASIGLDFQGDYAVSGTDVTPGTLLTLSLAGIYPLGDFQYGAELWGDLGPALTLSKPGSSGWLEDSEWTSINISTFVCYKASPDMMLKAALDVPIGTKATVDDMSDISTRAFRGVNVTLGGSWTI